MLCLLWAGMNMQAQMMGNLLDEVGYNARAKLVDEFFERFNGTEDRPDIVRGGKDYEKKRILVLFDGKMFKSFEDSLFVEAEKFADVVNKQKVKMDYADSTWVAHAVCNGKMKGKDVKFDLYLTVEHRRENLYKWVIAKAQGEIFELKASKVNERIMLMPDDHETNFVSLYRITHEKDNYITNYAKRGTEVDQTSVFLAYVYNGWLDIESVDELEFVFTQVQGYIFTIRDFKRDGNNSGWLINSFKKVSNKEKKEFLDFIHN